MGDLPPFLICLVLLVAAAAGGVLPFSPTEPMLVAVAAYADQSLLLPVVVLATAAQIAAKAFLFAASAKAERVLPTRARAMVARVRARLAGRRWLQILTVLVSAFVGLPPFYLVTVACGALRLPLSDYLIAGTIGRASRFTALVMLPQLFL